MYQGARYENLKFKAEIFRTMAFGVVSLFGSVIIHAVLVGVKLNWTLLWKSLAAIVSLFGYLILINISQGIMDDREWRLNRERRTKND